VVSDLGEDDEEKKKVQGQVALKELVQLKVRDGFLGALGP